MKSPRHQWQIRAKIRKSSLKRVLRNLSLYSYWFHCFILKKTFHLPGCFLALEHDSSLFMRRRVLIQWENAWLNYSRQHVLISCDRPWEMHQWMKNELWKTHTSSLQWIRVFNTNIICSLQPLTDQTAYKVIKDATALSYSTQMTFYFRRDSEAHVTEGKGEQKNEIKGCCVPPRRPPRLSSDPSCRPPIARPRHGQRWWRSCRRRCQRTWTRAPDPRRWTESCGTGAGPRRSLGSGSSWASTRPDKPTNNQTLKTTTSDTAILNRWSTVHSYLVIGVVNHRRLPLALVVGVVDHRSLPRPAARRRLAHGIGDLRSFPLAIHILVPERRAEMRCRKRRSHNLISLFQLCSL